MTCNAGSMAREAFLLVVCATSEPTWEEPGACDVEAQTRPLSSQREVLKGTGVACGVISLKERPHAEAQCTAVAKALFRFP